MNTTYTEGKESQKFNLKKPTKKEMEELLDSLEALVLAEQQDGYNLGANIARLMRYFAPNDTAKTVAQDPVRWCLQAVSVDLSRLRINAAKIIDGCLVATDGVRLHILKNYTDHEDGALLADGTWISEAEYSKEYGTFPEYKNAIPDNPKTRPPIQFSVDQKSNRLLFEIENKSGTGYDSQKSTCCLIEARYKQAVAGMENPSFKMDGELSPLVLESGDRKAVIMTTRLR